MRLPRATAQELRTLLRRADELELSHGAQQRLKWFLYAAEHDWNVSRTCRHFGISRSTYLRWAQRFDRDDPQSLEEHSRRPHHVRLPETDDNVVLLIRQLRQENPTMGKERIVAVLRQEHGVRVSASTVGRIIQRYGLFFAESQYHRVKRRIAEDRSTQFDAQPSQLQSALPLLGTPQADADDESGAGAVGLPLAAILLATALAVGWTTDLAHAAESTSYRLLDNSVNYAEHDGAESNSYDLRGGVTWYQQPLTSNSYQIVTDPAAVGGSTGGTGGSTGGTSGGTTGGGANPDDGGYRGHRTNERPPTGQVTPPPVSSASSSSTPASTSASSQTSSSSSVPPVVGPPVTPPLRPAAPRRSFFGIKWPNFVFGSCPEASDCFLNVAEPQPVPPRADLCPDGEPCEVLHPVAPSRRTWFPEFIATFIALLFALLEIARLRRLLGGAPRQDDEFIGGICTRPPKSTLFTEFQAPDAGFRQHDLLSAPPVTQRKKPVAKKKSKRRKGGMLSAFIGLLVTAATAVTVFGAHVPTAQAVTSAPLQHVYNGHLLDSSGNAVTTAVSIRFSYWKSADYQTGDVDGAGAINTGASNYAGWSEVHTVTPNANGYFSVRLGSGTALPTMSGFSLSDLVSLHLQVEVKPSASANTAYELLDPNSNAAIDRSPVLSVPFALNSDLLDQRDTGTGSGNIAVLQTGGVYPTSVIPGGTNQPRFVIDADSGTSSGALLFGGSLSEYLRFNPTTDRFEFSDDLYIGGNLTVNGLINGVDITSLTGGSSSGTLYVSSGGGLNVNVTGGTYRLDGRSTTFAGQTGVAVTANTTNYVFIGSGGLKVYTTGFPTDESYIGLATVTTNAGAVTNVDDVRATLSDDRTHTRKLVLHPEYPGASYVADGSENTGQMSIQKDGSTLYNYYQWTSTRTSLQDYQISARVTLPDDFIRWGSGVYVTYRSTTGDSNDNQVDIALYDTAGSAVTLVGSATDLASATWATTNLTFSGSPTWTPGQEIVFVFTVSAKNDNQIHLGDLELVFVQLDRE